MHAFQQWFSPDICPGVGLLDHMVALFLGFFFYIEIIFIKHFICMNIPKTSLIIISVISSTVFSMPFSHIQILFQGYFQFLQEHLCELWSKNEIIY